MGFTMTLPLLTRFTVLLASTSLLFSCGNLDNPKERNRLIFTDSIKVVADRIHSMNEILMKTKRQNYIYAIDSSQLYIYGNNKIGLITDSLLSENSALFFINAADRKAFVDIAKYLNENYLSRCDIEKGQPIYMYRADIYMADRQMDLFRFVVFANSEQEIDLSRYKILDKQRSLYLLAYKEAEIWSDK